MGKRARTSFRSMIFYEIDGWTKEELDECCVRGEFCLRIPNGNLRHYILAHRAAYDVDMLMDRISQIVTRSPVHETMSKRELLETLNG